MFLCTHCELVSSISHFEDIRSVTSAQLANTLSFLYTQTPFQPISDKNVNRLSSIFILP